MRDGDVGVNEVSKRVGMSCMRSIEGIPEAKSAENKEGYTRGYNTLNGSSIRSAVFELLGLLRKGQAPSQELIDTLIDVRADWLAIESSTCNACGETKSHFTEDCGVEHARFEVHWGYSSNKDTETHTIVLCEKCYDQYIGKPLEGKLHIGNYMFGGIHDMIQKGEIERLQAEVRNLKTGAPMPPHKRPTWESERLAMKRIGKNLRKEAAKRKKAKAKKKLSKK